MKKIYLLFAGWLCFAYASAQPRLPEHHYYTKLANGLEVVVVENDKVPLATIEVAVKNGSFTEDSAFNGLSHLYEHMFFKANKKYPDYKKYDERTRELGMSYSGSTGEEFVNYYFSLGNDKVREGLEFMIDALRDPIFDTADIVLERAVVNNEFQRMESDGFGVLYLELQKQLWGKNIYRKNAIGLHDVINTATPEKMRIIKDKYYHPNNSLLSIAGDVKHEDVFKMVEEVFGSWPKSEMDPHVKYPIEEIPHLTETKYHVLESSIITDPLIALAWTGPDTKDDSLNTIVADVFTFVLRLNASKLQQAIKNTGLATYSEFAYYTQRNTGPILFFVFPDPKRVKECFAAIQAQLAQMHQPGYITAEQLSTAKQYLKRTKILELEKPSLVTNYLSFTWSTSSLAYYGDYFEAMEKVSLEQISSYAEKYIKSKPHVAVMGIGVEQRKLLQPESFFKP